MVRVSEVFGASGWFVEVTVGDRTSAVFGPYTPAERDACVEGMKAFATQHIVHFAGLIRK